MRVLLDENLPKRLLNLFGEDVRASTVGQCGWKGLKNGELLALASREFDIFVTVDKGIPHQQELERFDMLFILLNAKNNSYVELAMLMDEVNAVLSRATSSPDGVNRLTLIEGAPG